MDDYNDDLERQRYEDAKEYKRGGHLIKRIPNEAHTAFVLRARANLGIGEAVNGISTYDRSKYHG